jgi:RNA polymerase sigma-70 factor (ECF subfamily)
LACLSISTARKAVLFVTEEKHLIKQAQSGDREAFCELAKIYGRRLHLFALRYCRSATDAEDLSQEVWLRAFRAIDGFRGEASFYTWLRRIAILTFLNSQRTQSAKNELLADDDFENLNGWHQDFAGVLENRLLVEKVREFLADITPAQRLVFLLKHDEGMTCAEIAVEMDCSVGTIKKSLFRTMQKLREKMNVGNLTEQKLEI